MSPSRHFLLLLAMLAVSCGEREKAGGKEGAGDAGGAPHGKERERPGAEETGPDAKAVLRANLNLALAETDPAGKEKALERVAWDGIDVDPALAREAYAALEPDGEAARRLTAHFAGRLADIDPEQAIEWARGLEHEQERAGAFGRIGVVISASDPERGAALVMAEMPAGSPRDRAVVQVAQRWAQAAPEAAAAWISSQPEGAARSAGLREIAVLWSAEDFEGLARWIGAREGEAARMEGLLAAAATLKGEKPAAREEKLAGIRDAEIRRDLENLLEQEPAPVHDSR